MIVMSRSSYTVFTSREVHILLYAILISLWVINHVNISRLHSDNKQLGLMSLLLFVTHFGEFQWPNIIISLSFDL